MKKRDIILDFTSLLDVTLIMVFFFVIFSHLDSQINKAAVDEKVRELNQAIEQAEARELRAEELEEQLQKEIEIVKSSDRRRGANVNEIISFRQSGNIKILLDMASDSWEIRVLKANELVGRISEGEPLDEKLITLLENSECSTEDTILCDFVYDGSKPGSNKACRLVTDSLKTVCKKYSYLYISETDLSIGE